MNRISFTPRAEKDIDEIYDFTAERWEIAKAASYIQDIREKCRLAANRQLSGRGAQHIRAGYRRLNVGSHVIFFTQLNDGIEVIRILHSRMDFDRQL